MGSAGCTNELGTVVVGVGKVQCLSFIAVVGNVRALMIVPRPPVIHGGAVIDHRLACPLVGYVF